MQEQDLIERIARHDPKGAEELLQHYGPLMQYVIRPIVADERDREECVSESVLRVLDKIHLYDPARGSWTGWITAITAKEKHLTMGVSDTNTFCTVQDALQFAP